MPQTTVEGAPSEQDVDDLFQPQPEEFEGEGTETEGQPKAQPKGEQKPAAEPAKAQPAVAPLTKEDFFEGISKLVPQQQQKQLTPQELDQMLQVWNPDEKFIGTFFNPDATPQERIAAFVQLRDGLMRQALTASRYMLDIEREQLAPKLSAVETYIQEQNRSKMREDFLGQYPGLKKYSKLMKFVSQQVEESGYKATDLASGYKHLADEATKFIRENIDPDFDPAAEGVGVATQQQTTTNVDGMPGMARAAGRGAQGMAKTTKSGQQVGPDGGIWDD